jgi:hypothetical protein
MGRSFFGRIAAQWAVLTCVGALVGCSANWHANYKDYSEPYEHGDYAVASQQVTHIADSGVDTDKVLLRLEEGAILRTAGELKESNTAFDQAGCGGADDGAQHQLPGKSVRPGDAQHVSSAQLS